MILAPLMLPRIKWRIWREVGCSQWAVAAGLRSGDVAQRREPVRHVEELVADRAADRGRQERRVHEAWYTDAALVQLGLPTAQRVGGAALPALRPVVCGQCKSLHPARPAQAHQGICVVHSPAV